MRERISNKMMEKENFNVVDIFGENVFNDSVMQARLPKKVYKKLHEVMEEVTIDLLNMTASWKEGSFPIRMPAEAREALSRGRWDSIAELLVNMDAVEKKNAELPQVTASC